MTFFPHYFLFVGTFDYLLLIVAIIRKPYCIVMVHELSVLRYIRNVMLDWVSSACKLQLFWQLSEKLF